MGGDMRTPIPDDFHLARDLYMEYSRAVGGVNFRGEPLPTWEAFHGDASKTTQSNAWIAVGALVRRRMLFLAGERMQFNDPGGPVRMVLMTGVEGVKSPGQFCWVDDMKEMVLWLPGDTMPSRIKIIRPGDEGTPRASEPGPKWIWDGNAEHPTLNPSLHSIGVYHGWAKKGILTQA